MTKRNKAWKVMAAVVLLLLTACRGAMSPQEAEETCASGVIAVMNRYYYKVELRGGHTFWFVPRDDALTDIRFFTEEQQVKARARTVAGAGFFMTDDGMAVTHIRIASPPVNTADVTRALANQLSYLKRYYSTEAELYARRSALVKDAFATLAENRVADIALTAGNPRQRAEVERTYAGRRRELEAIEAEVERKLASAKGTIRELDHFNHSEVTIVPVQQLTAATVRGDGKGFAPYRPCTLMAADPRTGLAVVRLNTRLTPDGCHVFDITAANSFLARLFHREQGDNRLLVIGINNNRPVVFERRSAGTSPAARLTFTAPVPAGNWGSPVLDASGTLVGITSSDSSNEGDGTFAIALNRLFEVVKVE